MSRIRGIEAKLQKEVLQTSRNGSNENNNKKNEDQSFSTLKDDVERQQINELLHKLPKLDKLFSVYRKIGEGTFSSVYLGSLRQHADLPDANKRWFAIKHLVPTAHPARIEHELRCLQDMGGKNNVIGVDLCLRHFDTIVFIMPYIPHRKFSEYVGEMDAEELRQYMRALLAALRHVHSFGVIHRDVKPSNFLYDRPNRRYLLVDFGLAQRVVSPPPLPAGPPAPPPPAHNNLHKRVREEEDSPPDAKRVALDLTVGLKNGNGTGNGITTPVPVPKRVPAPIKANVPKCKSSASVQGAVGGGGGGACACAGAGGVCGACALRPAPRAPRAGTQGFRPPEVLLKYQHQTQAVDVWACGVVLCSVLSARYPFFRAADDASALAELADLLGTAPLQRAAHALGRRLVVSSSRRGLCLRKLCARLRSPAPPALCPAGEVAGAAPPCARCRLPQQHCLCLDDSKPMSGTSHAQGSVAGFPEAAFELAARLLEPDPRARPTAARALLHPFLAERD